MTHAEPGPTGTTPDLFGPPDTAAREAIGAQACVLRGFALPWVPELLDAVQAVVQAAPLRHMQTPGGFTMSVALTNCGTLGWTTDRHGYRYSSTDPQSGQAWPALPTAALAMAPSAGALRSAPRSMRMPRYTR